MKHSIRDEMPFYHPEAVKFLSSVIKPDWKVLETGCGSSTIWFALHAQQVITFEHSKLWHTRAAELLEERGIKNVDLRFAPTYPWTGIQDSKEGEFDLIAVDGSKESRVKSVKTAHAFLKSGGYLLLDDTDYSYYDEAKELLKDWERFHFGGKKRHATTIWRKP